MPMPPTDHHPPAGAVEACRSCGAPLAVDQRYCLECGARRADTAPAVPALGATRTERTVVAAAPARVAGAARGNVAVVAAVGCLLLAMGVGVLIGRSGDNARAVPAAAPAPVIHVTSGAATGGGSSPATAPTTKHRAKHAAASAKTQAKPSKAIKDLQKLSPSEYQKKAAKLPKTVGTGGKPPPKDHKAPAGGGGFETIG